MKLFKKLYVPHPKGKYVEINQYGLNEEGNLVLTEDRMVLPISFFGTNSIDEIMENLSAEPENMHPIRMKKILKLNIK